MAGTGWAEPAGQAGSEARAVWRSGGPVQASSTCLLQREIVASDL